MSCKLLYYKGYLSLYDAEQQEDMVELAMDPSAVISMYVVNAEITAVTFANHEVYIKETLRDLLDIFNLQRQC